MAGARAHWRAGFHISWIPGRESREPQVGEPGRLRGSPALPLHVLPVGQEALRKIITTLAVKNEEIQSFIYSLKQMLLNVEVRKAPPQKGWKAVGKPWTGGWKGQWEGAVGGLACSC